MGKFESYESADSLNDDDITLYNKNAVTHKLTFATLVTLIRNKIISIGGLISSISAGVGLAGGTITSNGTIKCNLKSETPSSLASVNISEIVDRQYAVGVDKNGKLSVNVPWTDTYTSYSAGNGVTLTNSVISTKVLSDTFSSLSSVAMGATASRQYAVGYDKEGYLSVNIPWTNTTYTAGAGLALSSKKFKANLASETLSSLTATTRTSITDREYPVGLDANGHLSVNVPWINSGGGGQTYTQGDGIVIDNNNNIISTALKSYTKSSLASANMGSSSGRQYAVGLDSSGYLSVNIPWENTKYTAGLGLNLSSNSFKVKLANETLSSLTATTRTSTADREYPVGLDANGNLSVNVPWTSGSGGMNTNGSNADSHVTFSGTFTVGNRISQSTVGTNSVAEGSDCTASGDYSHAEGNETLASGISSHAEGTDTEASAVSHAEGRGQNTINVGWSTLPTGFKSTASRSISSNGIGSHAEGYTKISSNYTYTGIIQSNGQGSHAEGYAGTSSSQGGIILASGNGSHAEGYAANNYSSIISSGDGSHAEGYGTTSSGDGSHSEGGRTVASNDYAHAEGWATTARGESSHAEGSSTFATGNYSHASGYGVDAKLTSSFVHGGYNRIFNNYSRGIFGIQPDGQYYDSDTTLGSTDAWNGKGGSLAKNINLTIPLDYNYAIYLLMSVSYDENNNDVIHGMATHMIATTQTNSVPSVLQLASTTDIPLVILKSSNSTITLQTLQYHAVFHLIRIM